MVISIFLQPYELSRGTKEMFKINDGHLPYFYNYRIIHGTQEKSTINNGYFLYFYGHRGIQGKIMVISIFLQSHPGHKKKCLRLIMAIFHTFTTIELFMAHKKNLR